MQQIHRIAYLRERLGALFGFLLARRYMRDAHEGPLVAEALDRLKACNVSEILSSKGTMGGTSMTAHLGPLFFEQHLALDQLVVCARASSFAIFETVGGGG